MSIDLKVDHPELADAVLAGEISRDEAMALAIVRTAIDQLNEHVPAFFRDAGFRIRDRRRRREATPLNHVLAKLDLFASEDDREEGL